MSIVQAAVVLSANETRIEVVRLSEAGVRNEAIRISLTNICGIYEGGGGFNQRRHCLKGQKQTTELKPERKKC